jgi:transposase
MLLTMKEEKKLIVVQKVMDGTMDIEQGAKVLGVSERQLYRLMASVREGGPSGLIHGNRGNQHARQYDVGVREKVLRLVRGQYKDINDTHLAELLREREGIEMSREGLRQLLRRSGVEPKRKRRGKVYRRRRDRKAAFGTMIQLDASLHDWLEGRFGVTTLVGGIDDATSKVWARFEASECTWGYLRLIQDIVESDGIPLSVYTDRHTILHSPKEPTVTEQLEGVASLTQVGRACKELGIEMLKAYSPQAKGRIERLWGTFQDRLVVEMRLAGISTREEANSFLKKFLPRYNAKFSVAPKAREAVFQKKPSRPVLKRILCLKETRTVKQDHTISFEGLILQIPRSSKWVSIAKQKVEVFQFQEGSLEVRYKQHTVLSLSKENVQGLTEKYHIKKEPLQNAA